MKIDIYSRIDMDYRVKESDPAEFYANNNFICIITRI